MDLILTMKLNFFTILGHVIVSRVMTFRSKKFGKYVVCDGLYNSILCVIKINFFQCPSHIQKDFFHVTNTK
jgi:hypothetical protein